MIETVGGGSISTEGNLGDIGSISMFSNGDSGKSQRPSGCPSSASGMTVGVSGMSGVCYLMYTTKMDVRADNCGGRGHDCVGAHVIRPSMLKWIRDPLHRVCHQSLVMIRKNESEK